MVTFFLSAKQNTLLTLCQTALGNLSRVGGSFHIAENAYQFQPTTVSVFLLGYKQNYPSNHSHLKFEISVRPFGP